MSMHINEDRESQLLLVGIEERVKRHILTSPPGLKADLPVSASLQMEGKRFGDSMDNI
jgi:hypothetical protein